MHFNIKKRLLVSVLALISIIIVSMTIVTYIQHHNSQIYKFQNYSKSIITPFIETIKTELPSSEKNMNLYLKVALLSKGSSKLPFLLKMYEDIKGISYFDLKGNNLLHYGNIDKINLEANSYYIHKNKIYSIIPLLINDKHYGDFLIAFSSDEFDKERTQILINGSIFFIIFLFIGFLGNYLINRNIFIPIERLASHIRFKGLEEIPFLSRNDEIGEFSRTIDELAKNIAEHEKLILEQKEEFESIFRYNKDGMVILDLEFNFIDQNIAYINMLEYSEENFSSIIYSNLLYETEIPKWIKYQREILEKGFIQDTEIIYVSKSGKQINANMSAFILPDKRRILLLSKDITMTKLLEKQSKLATMGEMIGNIAHQWRQPLSVITIAASGLHVKSEYMEIEKSEIADFSEKILNQANYLSQTIDDFTNFIKGEQNFKEISLKSCIEKVFSLTDAFLSSNYIKVIKNIEDDAKIYGNSNEIEQALINIINNAKDILLEKTKINDRYIFVSTQKNTANLFEIIIQDSGGGIPENIIDKIFEPYYTTKHESVGTGIGLLMVDKILRERHKAVIKTENKEVEYNDKKYKGACFTIIFNLNSKSSSLNEIVNKDL